MKGLHTAAILCCLVITIAGCGGAADGPESPSPSPTVGSPTAGPPTGTPTATDESTSAAYGPDPNATAIYDAHNASLRAAGSFVVRMNQTLSSPESNQSLFTHRRTEVDFTTGEILQTRQATLGANTTTYVAPDGSAYERVDRRPHGTLEYREPAFPPSANETLSAQVLDLLAELNTSHESRRVDGRTIHRYVAEGVESAPPSLFGDVGTENVTEFRVSLGIVEGGHVRSFAYDIALVGDTGPLRIRLSREVRKVGTATVEPPAWLSKAKREIETTPTSAGPETLATARSDPAVTVEVDVPRPAGALDPEIRDPSDAYYNDGLNASRVGFVARLYWPAEATEVRITAGYDPADLPAGYAEANVTLARFDPDAKFFYPVESVTVDVENDVVSGTIPPEYRGQTFVVVNYRRYLALFE